MELLTVFWVDAAGTWTLRKVFSSKARITHLSSHVANGCYGLRSPWAPRQHQRPKCYPIYAILYVGSHTPPLLPLHIKSTSAAVNWVVTAQMETQDHSIYTYPVVSHASHDQVNQWMARAVRSRLRSLLPSSDAQHAEVCWRQCLHTTCQQARSLSPHHLPEDIMWAELSTESGLFLSLLHEYFAIHFVKSSPGHCPS